VQLLLEAHAPVDAADTSGRTALHEAAKHGHAAVAQPLLSAHATVDAADANGCTALHEAAGVGNSTIVQLLLDAQAAVDAAAADSSTALYRAASKGHFGVVQLLLNAQADVSSAAVGGVPLVCSAAAAGHMQTVQLLLAAPQLTSQAMAGAAVAAAAAGHAELAIVVLKALMSRDEPAAAAELAGEQSLAAEVLRLWEAADDTIKQEEARWPDLQQLLMAFPQPTSRCGWLQQPSLAQSVLQCRRLRQSQTRQPLQHLQWHQPVLLPYCHQSLPLAAVLHTLQMWLPKPASMLPCCSQQRAQLLQKLPLQM
jgi:ankyrin repeat protein